MKLTMLKWILFGVFFVLLHDPNHNEVYVNAEQVDVIARPAKGEHPTACTRALIYGVPYYFVECPPEIKRKIDEVVK